MTGRSEMQKHRGTILVAHGRLYVVWSGGTTPVNDGERTSTQLELTDSKDVLFSLNQFREAIDIREPHTTPCPTAEQLRAPSYLRETAESGRQRERL